MRLERVDAAADTERVRACHAMYLAGAPADYPAVPPMSERAFAGWLERGWSEDHPQAWLAADGAGEPAGWYLLGLPEWENTHLASISLLVAPARRRAGLGTALVRHAAGQAADSGRRILAADARQGSAAEAFFRAIGATPGIAEVDRVLRLGSIPAGRRAALRAQAEAAARGYLLLSWDGPAPEAHVDALAALAEAINDAPRGAGREGQRWDAQRVREDEQRMAGQGLRYYAVAAAGQRGELAAVTQLAVDPARPEWGFQELTAVARPHRGHRLGLLVKLAMLDLLAAREPQLTTILTGNADANKHMIAINEQLGFTEADRWLSWDLEVARALALPQRDRL
ncbi:MAG: GNAT family N-acetyltransferase [Actinobacteria bacterium]|nr:GNAT family N-acetyltransferase [Actinomycetota bacterium]